MEALRKMRDLLSRLVHRKRWQRLDLLTHVWIAVGDDARDLRQQAAQAVGEQRWRLNYLAALAEQIVADAQTSFRAAYRHDDVGAATAWGRVVRASRQTWDLT